VVFEEEKTRLSVRISAESSRTVKMPTATEGSDEHSGRWTNDVLAAAFED